MRRGKKSIVDYDYVPTNEFWLCPDEWPTVSVKACGGKAGAFILQALHDVLTVKQKVTPHDAGSLAFGGDTGVWANAVIKLTGGSFSDDWKSALKMYAYWDPDVSPSQEEDEIANLDRTDPVAASRVRTEWLSDAATVLENITDLVSGASDDGCAAQLAADELQGWLLEGRVHAYSQAIEGGACVPVPTEMWESKTTTLRHRFVFGRWNPEKAFGNSPKGTHYLFIEAASLDRALGRGIRRAERALTPAEMETLARVILEYDQSDRPTKTNGVSVKRHEIARMAAAVGIPQRKITLQLITRMGDYMFDEKPLRDHCHRLYKKGRSSRRMVESAPA